jgi:hypothetical protein
MPTATICMPSSITSTPRRNTRKSTTKPS